MASSRVLRRFCGMTTAPCLSACMRSFGLIFRPMMETGTLMSRTWTKAWLGPMDPARTGKS